MRNPHGYSVITYDDGTVIEGDTAQCCHCGCHWVVQPGSGNVRGWCFKCGAVTCGSQACDRCLPLEKWFEEVERKATRLIRLGV